MKGKRVNYKELDMVSRVQEIFRSINLIPWTSCCYCEAGCAKHIVILDLFAVMNIKQIYHNWNADYYLECGAYWRRKGESLEMH